MALLSANKLGVYILDQQTVSTTSPITITVQSTTSAGQTAMDTLNLPNDHLWAAVNSADEWLEDGATGRPNIYRHDVSESTHTSISTSLDLAYAATNSSLDFSTSVDEVVAKGTQCSSTTYTNIGANTWTITVDGLIAAGNSGSLSNVNEIYGSQIFDICNRGEYVVVKYQLDTTDGTGTNENDTVYIGQGIIESANISGAFDATQTYSATIRGYGKLYKFINS